MVRFFAQISRMVRDVPQFKHIENVFSFPVQKINLFIIFLMWASSFYACLATVYMSINNILINVFCTQNTTIKII